MNRKRIRNIVASSCSFFWYDRIIFGRTTNVHEINRSRIPFGEFHHLYHELRGSSKFHEYTRMDTETFDYILERIENKLHKRWSNFIKAPICPAEKLFVTLR